MDTKLKKSKAYSLNSPAGYVYGLGWILMVLCTVAAGLQASIAIALWEIYRWNLDEDYVSMQGYHDENGNWVQYTHKWTGEVTGPDFMDTLTSVGMAAISCAVVALVLLVLIMVAAGKFNREEDGRIHLNWYDRIWSEIHISAMIGFACGFCGLVALAYSIWPCQNWFGLFDSDYQDSNYFDIPNELAVALIVVGMTGSAIFCLTSLVSLVKKLKAHQFWEKSLIGGIWLFLWRGVRGSDRTTLKVMAYLLLLCTVAGFCGVCVCWYGWYDSLWIFAGAAACTGLIFLVVPAKIRKYKAIRSAAAEIRSGNLTYKIPVNAGKSGRFDELDRLAVDLNHIGDAQQAAVASELKNQRMKTELISNVSHDLKTPLTSMSAYIDLLKKEGLDSPNAPEYLDIIDKKTQRLKVLTENLFEAAKASSGAIPVSIGEIDLAALVTQSLAEMDEKLSARGLTAIVRNECEGDPDGCRVMADGQLLWRVIENILGNVSKYALAGSRVYVNVSKLVSQRPDRASKVLLEVKNISADPLNISADELMERFKRGDESRNTEGSGLGLAIAKDLAGLMGGVFEISIDGDLFKACVVLDEAVSARRIREMEASKAARTAKSARSAFADDMAAAAVQGMREASEKAGEKVGSAVSQASHVISNAGRAAGNAVGNAGSSIGGAVSSMKEKSRQHKAEKARKKLQKLQAQAEFASTGTAPIPPQYQAAASSTVPRTAETGAPAQTALEPVVEDVPFADFEPVMQPKTKEE